MGVKKGQGLKQKNKKVIPFLKAVKIAKKAVKEIEGTEWKRLKTKSRKRELVDTRRIVSYILRKNTNVSYQRIGDIFYRDHSVVMHYIKTVKELHDINFNYLLKEYEIFFKKKIKKTNYIQ